MVRYICLQLPTWFCSGKCWDSYSSTMVLKWQLDGWETLSSSERLPIEEDIFIGPREYWTPRTLLLPLPPNHIPSHKLVHTPFNYIYKLVNKPPFTNGFLQMWHFFMALSSWAFAREALDWQAALCRALMWAASTGESIGRFFVLCFCHDKWWIQKKKVGFDDFWVIVRWLIWWKCHGDCIFMCSIQHMVKHSAFSRSIAAAPLIELWALGWKLSGIFRCTMKKFRHFIGFEQ